MRNEIQIVLYTNVTGTNKITESCDSLFPELIKYIYKFWNKAIYPVYSVNNISKELMLHVVALDKT